MDELVTQRDRQERDRKLLDALVGRIEPIGREVIRAQLKRNVAEAAAHGVLDDAVVLGRLLARLGEEEPQLLDAIKQTSIEELVGELEETSGSEPDEAVVEERSKRFARQLVATWVDILDDLLTERAIVPLSEQLLPRLRSDDAEWRGDWEQVFRNVGLDAAAHGGPIMHRLAHGIGKRLDLPLSRRITHLGKPWTIWLAHSSDLDPSKSIFRIHLGGVSRRSAEEAVTRVVTRQPAIGAGWLETGEVVAFAVRPDETPDRRAVVSSVVAELQDDLPNVAVEVEVELA